MEWDYTCMHMYMNFDENIVESMSNNVFIRKREKA